MCLFFNLLFLNNFVCKIAMVAIFTKASSKFRFFSNMLQKKQITVCTKQEVDTLYKAHPAKSTVVQNVLYTCHATA